MHQPPRLSPPLHPPRSPRCPSRPRGPRPSTAARARPCPQPAAPISAPAAPPSPRATPQRQSPRPPPRAPRGSAAAPRARAQRTPRGPLLAARAGAARTCGASLCGGRGGWGGGRDQDQDQGQPRPRTGPAKAAHALSTYSSHARGASTSSAPAPAAAARRRRPGMRTPVSKSERKRSRGSASSAGTASSPTRGFSARSSSASVRRSAARWKTLCVRGPCGPCQRGAERGGGGRGGETHASFPMPVLLSQSRARRGRWWMCVRSKSRRRAPLRLSSARKRKLFGFANTANAMGEGKGTSCQRYGPPGDTAGAPCRRSRAPRFRPSSSMSDAVRSSASTSDMRSRCSTCAVRWPAAQRVRARGQQTWGEREKARTDRRARARPRCAGGRARRAHTAAP